MSQYDSTAASRIPASANSNNATVAKASGGVLRGVQLNNATAGVKYLKFYDKATTPAPASDNALLMATFALPASSVFTAFGMEQKFLNGISYALVTGSGDTDNTSVAANDILGLNVFFV